MAVLRPPLQASSCQHSGQGGLATCLPACLPACHNTNVVALVIGRMKPASGCTNAVQATCRTPIFHNHTHAGWLAPFAVYYTMYARSINQGARPGADPHPLMPHLCTSWFFIIFWQMTCRHHSTADTKNAGLAVFSPWMARIFNCPRIVLHMKWHNRHAAPPNQSSATTVHSTCSAPSCHHASGAMRRGV